MAASNGPRGWRIASVGASLALAFAVPAEATAQATPPPSRGQELYVKWCAGCHGVEGRGDGPAADRMVPRPRDFTQALYQIRTTSSGSLPTDDDILRVLDNGMPGTAMPGWSRKLSAAERRELLPVLKSFSRFFETEPVPEPYRIGKPPGVSAEGLAEGRRIYEEIECWKCHGDAGRGDGTSSPTLRDDADDPIRAADLSENWTFNGGGTVEAIYARLRTGLDGTPMPTFSDLLDSNVLTEEQLWRLAQYVRSLAPEKPPFVRDVVRAVRVEGALPASPDDSAWNGIERFYFPLVGQIVVPTRWFAPRVDGVFVQAMHNGEELALRFVWHDPSRSPDPAWLEWQTAVLEAMYTEEEPAPTAVPRPDALAVQFPPRIPEGAQRPYFLMGDATNPVYLWHWQSEPGRAVEAEARGLARIQPQSPESQTLRHAAVFDRGEWRLELTRALATADSANEIQFTPGSAVPIAFFAWDGDNAEEGTRVAVSAWYYLALEQPTPRTAYFTPALAAIFTAGLGLLAVWRAQRRSGEERG